MEGERTEMTAVDGERRERKQQKKNRERTMYLVFGEEEFIERKERKRGRSEIKQIKYCNRW